MQSFFFFFIFLASLQLQISVNGADSPFAQIPRDLYHSSNELLKEIRALVRRHPDTLTIETKIARNRGYRAENNLIF